MGDNKVSVTVTVPVYNTSKYLRRCLDSLKMQTFKDIEFILVDDGSTDNSGEICEEYAKNDSRFRVIHQKNGGLASARQAGLDASQGEYVIVCDSDDWVEPEMYGMLYQKAKETNADIIACGYYAEYKDGRSIPVQYWFKEKNGIVDNDDYLRHGAHSSWVKLVKRSLLYCSGASYSPGINLGEDALIVFKYMRANPKIVQIRGNFYHYRRLFGEVTYTNHIKMAHVNQLLYIYNWLRDNYSDNKYAEIRRQRAVDIAFAYLRAIDTDAKAMNDFFKNELPLSALFNGELSIKRILVYCGNVLPIGVSKFILKKCYPLFFK